MKTHKTTILSLFIGLITTFSIFSQASIGYTVNASEVYAYLIQK